MGDFKPVYVGPFPITPNYPAPPKITTISSSGDSAKNSPYVSPQAWDRVIINGVPSPGVIPAGGLKGFSRRSGYQEKGGKGSQGATLTLTNAPPAKGSITFILNGQADFNAWESFQDFFVVDPAKDQGTDAALSIYHPALFDVNVVSVVPEEVSPITHAGKGKYIVEVKLIEYTPVPKESIVQSVTFTNNNQPVLQSAAAVQAQTSRGQLKTAQAVLMRQIQNQGSNE